jgi:hypothetical protein
MISEWIRMAGRRDIVLRSLRVSAIVGTALVAINQGDLFLAGGLPAVSIWKILLTYSVPYLVSTYASVAATVSAIANNTPDSRTD